ncbi:formylglycine-generating enzyme family protein [Gynuella sp.]|uniref:formylglycine-generating enzyme family protein n=1 Tax=Gynuella sp. TaxID=2969146 RepID=UPI003D0DA8A2
MIQDWMITIPKGRIFLRDDRKKKTWLETVDVFLLSRYPITQAIYQRVMETNPSTFQHPDHPVEGVSWLDAIQFCNQLSTRSGLKCYYQINADGETVSVIPGSDGYRLPTDAEWEYACRANSSNAQYGPVDSIGWYSGNSDQSTHPVGQKAANEFGLYDMLGNVWEWCWDVYDPEVYGAYRIFRGGGWADESRGCLASNRRRSHPTYTIDDLGFRVARDL